MYGGNGPPAYADKVEIGPWTFHPTAQTLERNGETIRLEHRASRLLELFTERADEVIARDDILAAIWNGRTLSENSVAVVVSDLRRALGDDARAPHFIETVPKRGYRMPGTLVRKPDPVPVPLIRRKGLVAAALAALGLLVAALVGIAASREGPVVITINHVRNQTNSDTYDAAAAAISEIGAAHLSRTAAPILVRDRWDFAAEDPSRGLYEDFGSDARVYHISSTIVLEKDRPRLVMMANHPRTHEVVWSYDAELDEEGSGTGAVVRTALDDFLRKTGLQD